MEEILDDFEEEKNYEKLAAPKGTRFANLLIDSIIVAIPLGLLTNYLVYGVVIPTEYDIATASIPLLDTVIQYLLLALYYILMENMTGKTIGKMITGTKVVYKDGSHPPIGKIIGRSFARYIPFEAFSFLGEKGIGWHDSMTDTYVIKAH